MTPTVVTLPLHIESLLNKREHWSARYRRSKANRKAACYITPLPPLPVSVLLCRIGPRPLDGDNLQSGFKSLRDGIAARYGIDDNDPRIEWLYAQERGKAREYAARITITPRES